MKCAKTCFLRSTHFGPRRRCRSQSESQEHHHPYPVLSTLLLLAVLLLCQSFLMPTYFRFGNGTSVAITAVALLGPCGLRLVRSFLFTHEQFLLPLGLGEESINQNWRRNKIGGAQRKCAN